MDILKYLHYFHCQRNARDVTENSSHSGNLTYDDVMAALLSLVADLMCIAAR